MSGMETQTGTSAVESAGRPTRFATCSLLDLLVIRFKQGRTFLTPQHVKTVFETGKSMPTLRFTRLSKPEVVRSIDPNRLLTLLKPHAEFLKSRGLTLPTPSKASQLDHQRLMPILMSPGEKAPPDLLDALSMIDQMSAPRAIDVVLDHLSWPICSSRPTATIRPQTSSPKLGCTIAKRC